MEHKVYVVNKGGHDFSSAESYGELVYLSEGSLNRYAVTNMYRQFSDILKESDSEDYILLTGLTTMGVVACSIFSYLHGKLNILLFKQGRYVDRSLVLSELLVHKPYTDFEHEDEQKRVEDRLMSTGLTHEQIEKALQNMKEEKNEEQEKTSN